MFNNLTKLSCFSFASLRFRQDSCYVAVFLNGSTYIMNFINFKLSAPSLFLSSEADVFYRPGDIPERRTIREMSLILSMFTAELLYLEQDPFRIELECRAVFIITPDTPHRGSRVCEKKTTTSWVHFYTNGKYSLSDEFYPDNVTRRAAPKFFIRRRISFLSLPRTGTVPEANRGSWKSICSGWKPGFFQQIHTEKSFPSSVRTPFELQNDFIEFLQVLYAPYCYSRGRKASPGRCATIWMPTTRRSP